MKKLLVTLLFLITSFLGFGQSVSAPDPKSFTLNTSGQDASGFSLSGFNSTANLLASISLVNPPASTTFYLTTTTGLTAASGFTLTGNKTRLVVTGTQSNINTALASLKVNTGSVVGNVQISVAATINPTGYFYNGVNGHFYRPISTGATYPNAKLLSSQQTFKGQQGYLVTITSASEDAFIFTNVPQSQIWFALTDEVTEGRWVIDAGPEAGTLIKTSNGQTAGNIVGQYNNWAGGEPNNSGNEDYAVTKWNGSQWNDLPAHFVNPYVIEFGTWTNPDDATFTDFYSNSVIHSNGDVLRVAFNLNFNGGIDETKFSAKMHTKINNVWTPSPNAARFLNGLGKVDMTNDFDTTKLVNGKKAIIVPGQVEWSLINPYEANLNGHRLQIDERVFGGTGINLNNIKSVKLFDIYEGPVTPLDFGGWWKQWTVPGNINLATKVAASSFQSNIRLQDGWYAFKADYTFVDNTQYKEQAIVLQYSDSANALLDQIVTVSDVFTAFKELSNGGIFGNQSGNEFTSGIQFMNADVNSDNEFNEQDTYLLLQHLTGQKSLLESNQLVYMMKLINKPTYDLISKTNWKSQNNSTTILYPFSIGTNLLNSYDVSVAWKGDVNLSHSTPPAIISNQPTTQSMNVRTMSVVTSGGVDGEVNTELIDGKIIATIKVNPNSLDLVGTQFRVNYDNTILKFEKVDFVTKGNPTNYGTNKGNYINVGSLITGEGVLDNTTEYKITFTPISSIQSILGLVSFSVTDAVGKNGSQLKIKLL